MFQKEIILLLQQKSMKRAPTNGLTPIGPNPSPLIKTNDSTPVEPIEDQPPQPYIDEGYIDLPQRATDTPSLQLSDGVSTLQPIQPYFDNLTPIQPTTDNLPSFQFEQPAAIIHQQTGDSLHPLPSDYLTPLNPIDDLTSQQLSSSLNLHPAEGLEAIQPTSALLPSQLTDDLNPQPADTLTPLEPTGGSSPQQPNYDLTSLQPKDVPTPIEPTDTQTPLQPPLIPLQPSLTPLDLSFTPTPLEPPLILAPQQPSLTLPPLESPVQSTGSSKIKSAPLTGSSETISNPIPVFIYSFGLILAIETLGKYLCSLDRYVHMFIYIFVYLFVIYPYPGYLILFTSIVNIFYVLLFVLIYTLFDIYYLF